MKALAIVWAFGVVGACSGGKERGQSAPETTSGRRLRVVYDIDIDKVVDDRAAELQRDLETALAEQHLAATVRVTAVPLGGVTITPADPTTRTSIEKMVKSDHAATTESVACDASAGAGAICVKITSSYADAVRKAALASAVKTIRDRLDQAGVASPSVIERAGQIVVEFPVTDPAGLAIRSLVARRGTLEFKVVDDGSEYMKRLYARVSGGAAGGELTADIDRWQAEDGSSHTDYFVMAHDRQTIERYLSELSASDPGSRVPDDREIGYELVAPDASAKDPRPYWRIYYLERAVRLDGSAIANAEGSYDPSSNQAIVLLDFNRHGGQVFGDLTAAIVGRKLATILDGRITSAPIINGPIRGGRASITMGGSDPRKQETERDELVNVLKAGSLPAPLREVSATPVP